MCFRQEPPNILVSPAVSVFLFLFKKTMFFQGNKTQRWKISPRISAPKVFFFLFSMNEGKLDDHWHDDDEFFSLWIWSKGPTLE